MAGREAALSRLQACLTPAVGEVVTDENRDGPFATYLRCLANPPEDATHLCILQDDTVPCRDFASRLDTALAERPNDIISLFVGDLGKPLTREFLRAMTQRDNWCPIPRPTRIVHVVALVWPVAEAQAFLDWYAANELKIPAARPHRSDDMVFSYWLKTCKPWRTVWATVPCLVEHPDDLPDVAHEGRKWRNGKDKGRRAIWFADR